MGKCKSKWRLYVFSILLYLQVVLFVLREGERAGVGAQGERRENQTDSKVRTEPDEGL